MLAPLRIALVAGAVLVFLLASAVLARVLSAASSERSAAVASIERQVRADRGRKPDILRVDQPERLAFGARDVTVRIVWRTPGARPVVQCVAVHRTGSLVGGFDVVAGPPGRPIPNEGECP